MTKKNNIQIAKVKYRESEGKIFIAYTRKANEFTDVRTSNSDEKAAPEFYEAMEALREHAGRILGFTDGQVACLRPHTVNFSYDKEEHMGAIISCVYETPSGKMTNINTPLMKCPTDEVDAQSPGFFDEDTVKALWEMELQARKYLDGQRAQMSLFGEEPGAADDDAGGADGEYDDDEADAEAAESPETGDNDEEEENIAAAGFAPDVPSVANVVGFPGQNRMAAMAGGAL